MSGKWKSYDNTHVKGYAIYSTIHASENQRINRPNISINRKTYINITVSEKNFSSNKYNTTARENDSGRQYMNHNHEIGEKILLNNLK